MNITSVIGELIFVSALPCIVIVAVGGAAVVLLVKRKNEAERKMVVGKFAATGIKWTVLLANALLKKRL